MPTLNHVEDPRRPLEKFRRRQLWMIAKSEGIPYPNGAAATTMREIISGADINVSKYEYLLDPDAMHGNNGTPHPRVPDVADPASMKMHELRAYAKNQGIPVSPSMKKNDILELLK